MAKEHLQNIIYIILFSSFFFKYQSLINIGIAKPRYPDTDTDISRYPDTYRSSIHIGVKPYPHNISMEYEQKTFIQNKFSES